MKVILPVPSLKTGSRKGAALVLVLGMLVLVLVLVVAFLSSVSVELQSAKKYAEGLEARGLADSAVSLVISQIQDATAQPQLAWASQPGMIRTYSDSGNLDTAYKLYSSDAMRVSGAFNPITSQATEVPAAWASDPALFVDLNKPVAVAGSLRYPILDPAAVATDQTGTVALDGSTAPIEGCFVDPGDPALSTANQPNKIPMPVRWLYVLQNGELIAPTGGSGGRATFSGPNAPTDANPIVGRIAFWTDDETSKVNLNTASEGTFWDRPWASSPSGGFDYTLARTIPAQNEFQRFPGHPAMTSLSVIFPCQAGESEVDYKARLYGLLPRIQDGGSKSGTQTVNYLTPRIVPDNERLFASVDEFFYSASDVDAGTRQPNPSGPSTDFTTSDIEKTRFFLTTQSRSPEVNMFNKPRISLWPLQLDPEPITGKRTQTAKDKLIAFCSTVGSGVSAKPYYFQRYSTFDNSAGGPNHRAAGAPYNPSQNPPPSSQSATADWEKIPRNQEIYAYLQSLTNRSIPGLGGKLGGSGGKYTSTARNQILTEMFDYVRSNLNVTTTGIPTASGTGGYTYVPFPPQGTSNAWTGQFQVVPLSLPNGTKGFGNFGTITQAALVFYRTDNVFVRGTEQTVPSQLHTGGLVADSDITSGPNPTMAAVLLLQPFTPSPGPPPWSANMRIRIEGLDQFSVTTELGTTSLGFPADAINLVTARDGQANATSSTGLELFTQYWPLNIKNPGSAATPGPPSVGVADEDKYYPFVSQSVPIPSTPPGSNPTFNFSGGKILIKIYSPYTNTFSEADLVQTIEMEFPNGSGWPLPLHAYTRGHSRSDPDLPADQTTVTQYNLLSSRFGSLETGGGYGVQRNWGHNPLPLIWSRDTVRAVEARAGGPARGDLRAIAGLQSVPSSFFEGHGLKDPPNDGKSYADAATTSRLIHSLHVDSQSGQSMTSFSGGYYAGSGRAGKLVQDADYYDDINNPNKAHRAPEAVRGLVQADMADGTLGDWDTGVGTLRDGPFINKADLGNVGSISSPTNGYYYSPGHDRSAAAAAVTDTGASYSPNRQISSAVAFGSLPTGLDPAQPEATKPWQTLLFCKNPAGGSAHPGFGDSLANNDAPPYSTPPDHAFLDLFTMPIVEPYAISEPFSTAGKVNMNYQIVPFTYLTRDTGVRAVLKSTRLMAIPTSAGRTYKYGANTGQQGGGYPGDFRYTIDPDESTGTLKGFQDRFSAGDIFRSATEICDIYLVPKENVDGTPVSASYDSMENWWRSYLLTGDNLREFPYGHIYPRLTTKSNTFTVHVIAQSLAKSRATAAAEFVEGKDQITGEFRGSFLIERYLDPNSDSLVEADGKTPATELDPNAMVGPYKFRVVNSKRFAP